MNEPNVAAARKTISAVPEPARRQAEHQFEIERQEDRQRDDHADHRSPRHRCATIGARSTDNGMNGSGARVQAAAEGQPQHRGAASSPRIVGDVPRIARAAPGHRQHQRQRGANHQQRADHVELVRSVVPRQFAQRAIGQHQRQQAERQIDPEDQRPMHVVGQHAAEHRAEDARRHEHHRGVGLVARRVRAARPCRR